MGHIEATVRRLFDGENPDALQIAQASRGRLIGDTGNMRHECDGSLEGLRVAGIGQVAERLENNARR